MSIILTVLVFVSLYFYLTGTHSKRRATHYRGIAQVERVRASWAEARNELLELVKSRELDIRSETFATLYRVQTFVLRHPNSYKEIAQLFHRAILSVRNGKSATKDHWIKERKSWPSGMNLVLDKIARGIEALLSAYNIRTYALLPPISRISKDVFTAHSHEDKPIGITTEFQTAKQNVLGLMIDGNEGGQHSSVPVPAHA